MAKPVATGRAIVLPLLISATASAQAPSATVVLANVQKFYAGQQQLTATFQQVVTQAAFGTTATTNGSVRVEKPSLFRLDYVSTKNIVTKSFIFDGKILWIIDVPNKQVIQNQVAPNAPNASMPAAVSFLTGAANLAKQFNVAINTSGKFVGTKATVLELTPKQTSAQIKTAVLRRRPRDVERDRVGRDRFDRQYERHHVYEPELHDRDQTIAVSGQPGGAAGDVQSSSSCPRVRRRQLPNIHDPREARGDAPSKNTSSARADALRL